MYNDDQLIELAKKGYESVEPCRYHIETCNGKCCFLGAVCLGLGQEQSTQTIAKLGFSSKWIQAATLGFDCLQGDEKPLPGWSGEQIQGFALGVRAKREFLCV